MKYFLPMLAVPLVFGFNLDSEQPPASQPASGLDKAFLAKTLKMPDGEERRYALYIPPQYDDDPNHNWPVIISLHGSGECGRDGVRQTGVGLPPHIARRPKNFPFITIMPQAHTLWFRGDDAAAVLAVLDSVLKEYRADPDRIYITGFSMGGFATWELTMIRPDLFAAAIPICGMGNTTFVSNIRNLPIWAFHGRLDQNVPVSGSRDPIEELKRLGTDPNYTEYATAGHNSWDTAYSSKKLWRWLLKQRRGAPPRVIDYVLPGRLAQVWWLSAQAEDGLEEPARIRAEIREDKRIIIESKGVVAVAVLPNSGLLESDDAIEVTWNGKTAYQGKFSNGFAIRTGATPESQPSERPN